MAIGTLFAVLGLLSGTAAAVSPSDILFLLGFGLHLAIVFRLVTSASEVDAVLKDVLKIVHTVILMVEQAHTGERHGDAILVAGLNHIVITDRAAGLCDKLHTALMGALDIVAEGEECI